MTKEKYQKIVNNTAWIILGFAIYGLGSFAIDLVNLITNI